ncbi:hypothetical protein ACIBQX_03050 [Nonomuraea sp. NPDC049714]|uniref:hypothetical protein n=1 Tax=Nonomuraea sp. NPDC049714 TaxID=3364357 RepID=UPI0037AC8E5C
MLVHDSLSLYNGYPGARHQLCGSHLVRELTAVAEDHPGQRRPTQIRWALAELNERAASARGRTDRDSTRTGQGLPRILPPRHPRRAVVSSSCARMQTVPGP